MRDLRATEAHRRTGRLLRWMLVVTLGEAIGFMVPAVVGAGMSAASWAPLPILIAMVLAGAVEGAVLGAAQADCFVPLASVAATTLVDRSHEPGSGCRMVAWDVAEHAR